MRVVRLFFFFVEDGGSRREYDVVNAIELRWGLGKKMAKQGTR